MTGYHQASKLKHFHATVRANGGYFKTLYKMWRFDTFKHGCLMGWDANGNKYYENQRYMIGRSRWVEYADYYKWEYEGSQVTPEWFGWLHYMTDQVPCCNTIKCSMRESECHERWLLAHEENLTATRLAYYPYSTTRSNLLAWNGVTNSPLCRGCMETEETASHVVLECNGVAPYRATHLGTPRDLPEVLLNIKGLIGFLEELGWLD